MKFKELRPSIQVELIARFGHLYRNINIIDELEIDLVLGGIPMEELAKTPKLGKKTLEIIKKETHYIDIEKLLNPK